MTLMILVDAKNQYFLLFQAKLMHWFNRPLIPITWLYCFTDGSLTFKTIFLLSDFLCQIRKENLFRDKVKYMFNRYKSFKNLVKAFTKCATAVLLSARSFPNFLTLLIASACKLHYKEKRCTVRKLSLTRIELTSWFWYFSEDHYLTIENGAICWK